MQKTLRPLAAEFIGVFMLTFIGAGAIVLNQYRDGSVGLVGIALAHGLALAIAVTATMNISGGHINPAITLGLFSVGRIGWKQAGLYVLAQVLGAVVAASPSRGSSRRWRDASPTWASRASPPTSASRRACSSRRS